MQILTLSNVGVEIAYYAIANQTKYAHISSQNNSDFCGARENVILLV